MVVPAGFTLVATATGVLDVGEDDATLWGIAVDGTIVNYVSYGLTASGALPFAVTASVAGDGNSHLVALQGYGYFIINSSDSELGPTIPVMTLVLAQSI